MKEKRAVIDRAYRSPFLHLVVRFLYNPLDAKEPRKLEAGIRARSDDRCVLGHFADRTEGCPHGARPVDHHMVSVRRSDACCRALACISTRTPWRSTGPVPGLELEMVDSGLPRPDRQLCSLQSWPALYVAGRRAGRHADCADPAARLRN